MDRKTYREQTRRDYDEAVQPKDLADWRDGWQYEPGEVAQHPQVTPTERTCRVCAGTGWMGKAVPHWLTRVPDNCAESDEIECRECAGTGLAWADPLVVVAKNRKIHHAGPVKSRAYYAAFGRRSDMARLRMVESAIKCDVACRGAVAAWRAAA